MRATLNGFGVNGASYPNWVVAAVVAATAAASVSQVAPARTTFGSVYGDANVVVTLTQTGILAGRVNATAESTSTLSPTLVFAGRVNATAGATGNAATRRDVTAQAGGDAGATGLALPNAKLGDATATASSTVDLAEAHRIRPAASLRYADATGSTVAASIVVNRRTTILATAGASGFGEPRIQLNGQSIWRHDGFVFNAMATNTVSFDTDKIAVIVTLGTFDFGQSASTSVPFVRHPGAAYGLGSNTGTVSSLRTVKVTAAGTANATATINALRTQYAQASGAPANATIEFTRSLQRFAGSATGTADVTVVTIAPVRTAYAQALNTAVSGGPQVLRAAEFQRAQAQDNGLSYGSATGRTQDRAFGDAEALGFATATYVYRGTATGTATSAVVQALAKVNAEVPAPDERYMLVQAELRDMIVVAEERTMRVLT